MLRKAQGRSPGLFYVPPLLIRLALSLSFQTHLWERIGEDLVVDTSKLKAFGWRPVIDTDDAFVAMMRSKKDEEVQQRQNRHVETVCS